MTRTVTAVALFLAAVAAYGQGGPSSAAPRWQRFVSEKGRFSVLMPGRPAFESKVLTGRTGRNFRYSSYLLDLGSTAYMVSYSDYDSQTESPGLRTMHYAPCTVTPRSSAAAPRCAR